MDTQQQTYDILLGHQSKGASRDREGKRLWEFGGVYEPEKSTSKKLRLPSPNLFTKMTGAVAKHGASDKPELVEYARDLKICSVFVTFLTNLYSQLEGFKSNKERMMLFEDYPYFFQITRDTKGPPLRKPSGGEV
ncbi:MAG: hypothetical protein L3J33_07975 [Rhodobacteraceae bacterium]|nr:hypothetical protein [Paracoccaceae bacterium]